LGDLRQAEASVVVVLRDVERGLEEGGLKGRLFSAQYLHVLRTDIETPYLDGFFNEEFYQERLVSFEWEPPATLPGAASIIVVAVPDPQRRITFQWHGEPVPAIVPPTYLYWQSVNRQVEDTLSEMLAPDGYQVVLANLPKKLAAVHSGLADYGRNNVTYVPGLGSFQRLVVLWSDLPCEEDHWQDLQMMEACEKCHACQRACPTGAIDPSRYLLRAERCLTFLNEKPPEVPFPDWVEPSWHNCLVGCLHCQRVCPANKEVRDWIEGDEVFSEEETTLLLDGIAQEHLPPETVVKLERLDLIDLLDVLPRNLSALLPK
jgi:epoxyqueuosine reductase